MISSLYTRDRPHPTDRAAGVDWRRILLGWIGCIQILYAAALLLPESQTRGLISRLQTDYNIPPLLIVGLFLFGFGHYLRGLRPRYSLLTSLVGQTLYAAFTLHYVLIGVFPLAVLASHGGTYLVCLMVVVAKAQNATGWPHLRGTRVHNLLMPAMSITLMVYACGVALQPTAGVAGWIQSSVGLLPLVFLNGWLFIGAGYIFHNHITAKRLSIGLAGQTIYALASIGYFVTSDNVPIVATLSHAVFAITSNLVVMVQTQEQSTPTAYTQPTASQGARP